ncbi:MAG: hypothetical protein ACRELG_15080 [Gemmataceae bacterium]
MAAVRSRRWLYRGRAEQLRVAVFTSRLTPAVRHFVTAIKER